MAMTGGGLSTAIKAAIAAIPHGDTTIPPIPDGMGGYTCDPANNGTDLDNNAVQDAMWGALVTYFHANAQAKIGAGVGGLQTDNTGGNPATLPPGTDKFLPIV